MLSSGTWLGNSKRFRHACGSKNFCIQGRMANLKLRTLFLLLSIILWGTLLGGIATSHPVYFPFYLTAISEVYGLDVGIFWGLIHPLLIVILITTLKLNWTGKARRKLIAISLGLYALAIAVTFWYFVPEFIRYSGPAVPISPAELLARGQHWRNFTWIRGVIMCAGIVPLLWALAKPAGNSEAPLLKPGLVL